MLLSDDPSPVACILCPNGILRSGGFPWWLIALVVLMLFGVAAVLTWCHQKTSSPEPTAVAEDDLLSRLTIIQVPAEKG